MNQNEPKPNCFAIDPHKAYEYVVPGGVKYSVIIDGKVEEAYIGPIKIYTVDCEE
jgi:hypothetical protein